MNTDWVALVLFGFIFGLLIIFGPLLTIWAINTLFGLGIECTFKTWAATFILFGVLNGARGSWSRIKN